MSQIELFVYAQFSSHLRQSHFRSQRCLTWNELRAQHLKHAWELLNSKICTCSCFCAFAGQLWARLLLYATSRLVAPGIMGSVSLSQCLGGCTGWLVSAWPAASVPCLTCLANDCRWKAMIKIQAVPSSPVAQPKLWHLASSFTAESHLEWGSDSRLPPRKCGGTIISTNLRKAWSPWPKLNWFCECFCSVLFPSAMRSGRQMWHKCQFLGSSRTMCGIILLNGLACSMNFE